MKHIPQLKTLQMQLFPGSLSVKNIFIQIRLFRSRLAFLVQVKATVVVWALIIVVRPGTYRDIGKGQKRILNVGLLYCT